MGVKRLRFSERLGIEPVRSVIQIDSMDSALKNGLWNVFYETVLNKINGELSGQPTLFKFFNTMWRDYFKVAVDSMPLYKNSIVQELKEAYFGGIFSSNSRNPHGFKWFEVYDFIEYVAQNFPYKNKQQFKDGCNEILKRELSGYRFVKDFIVRVTDETEIGAIETVLNSDLKINYAKNHIGQALSLMADKQAPDYRNSIKESISAVESIGNTILGKSSSSLGEVLKLLEKQTDIDLHPALKSAFMKLYGYTSDASGIRHSLTEDSTLSYEDAKYMLVACSAFVNYLIEKAIKAGIELN